MCLRRNHGGIAEGDAVDPPDSIWRNRSFVAAFAGSTINDVGDWMLEVALPVYVYVATGSGATTVAVYAIYIAVGVLFGSYGGSLADRWDLRTTMIVTSGIQALILLPLLWVTEDRIWPVFVVVAAQAIVSEINNPAAFALIPRMMESEQLVRANAAVASGWSVARLIGSPVGGIAVAAGGLDAVVIADSATFVVAAVAAAMIDRSAIRPLPDQPDDEPVDHSVRAGVAAVRSQPAMKAIVWISSLTQLAFAAFPVLFIVFVSKELGGDGGDIGIIRGASAFGGIIAGVVIGKYVGDRHPAWLMVVGYLSFGVSALFFVNGVAVTREVWVFAILFSLSGFPNVTSQVGMRSVAQRVCPPEILGRLSGLLGAAGAVGAGLGAAAAALLVDHVSILVLFNLQGQVFTLCGVIGYFFVLRRINRRSSTLGVDDLSRV